MRGPKSDARAAGRPNAGAADKQANRTGPEAGNQVANPRLEAAQHYAGLGWHVHPLPPRSKKPPLSGWQRLATTESATLEEWWTENPAPNVAVATGRTSDLVVIDVDGPEGELGLDGLQGEYGSLPSTAEQFTGNGRQLFFRYPEGIEIRNKAGLAGFRGVDVRANGGYAVLPPSIHPNGKEYTWELSSDPTNGCELAELPARWVQLLAYGGADLPSGVRHDTAVGGEPAPIPEGERNDTLFRLAAGMRARGFSVAAIQAALILHNRECCKPPLTDSEVQRIAVSAGAYPSGDSAIIRVAARPSDWPDPLDKAAYHGLVGDIVQAIEPHTEADPVALLIQCLLAFGSVVGRASYFVADGADHFPNIFAVLVGPTSKGRKGTSWAHIARLFTTVAPDWAQDRVVSGLSSGEGLIWAVRDPITKVERVKKSGRSTGETEEVVADPGIDDKRLLVIEAEFASTLRVLGRDGNTLSPIIRQAWDKGNLRSLTKNSPAQATGAHISLVGHVTLDELRRYLTRTEAGNGFGNRFLWLCVKRSKCLPEGGQIHTVDFGNILRRLAAAVQFASQPRELRRDDPAREVWRQVYPELSEAAPGLLGAVTARAEAQTMRLATLYALLNRSETIKTEHLLAALALWDYCEASARYVFGDALGDPVGDEILRALRNSPKGLTRTDLHGLFGRHRAAGELSVALGSLLTGGRVRCEKQSTGGRHVERWFALLGKASDSECAESE